jgi:2,6-dihydroxypseudooxynicotine hydrolase
MEQDNRVRSAIAHWGARFIANGVPYPDFMEVTAGIARWDDWCAAWAERGKAHGALGDQAAAAGYDLSAAEHYVTAAVCCHFGKFLFVHDPAQMKAVHELAVGFHRKALDGLRPPAQRCEIPFEGITLKANFRRPEGVASSPPLVVMVMGLDSAKEETGAYEQPFLDRGMAILAVDGPGQGEAEYDLALRPDFEVPFAAVIDWAVASGEIDADRIGLWGVSFGGYHAPRIAAFEQRAKACISLAGPFDFGADWDGFPPISRQAFEMRSKSADADEARDKAQTYSLAPVAHQITCPLYIVAGELDRIVPADDARKLAEAAGGEVVLDVIEGANHVANNRAYRYRTQTADWMAEQLLS